MVVVTVSHLALRRDGAARIIDAALWLGAGSWRADTFPVKVVRAFMVSRADVQKARHTQAGFLMRAYREGFVDENGRRGLSQEELLRRMAVVEGVGTVRYSRATISRWETGITRPNVERLRAFGRTLELSDLEVAGLILLAGLAPDFGSAGAHVGLTMGDDLDDDVAAVVVVGDEPSPAVPAGEAGGPTLRSLASFAALRFLLSGILTVVVGYALAAVGWDGDWMPVAYVGAAVGFVMVLGFAWPDRNAGPRDFLWVSLFFVLAAPSLQFAGLQMDHYGIYAMGDFAGTHLPYMLALLLSLALASAAAALFHLIWWWQYSGDRVKAAPLVRAVRAVLPPLVLAYMVVVALSNSSVWIQSSVVFAVLAGVLVSLLVMREPGLNPNQVQRRFLLNGSLAVSVAATTVGMAVILAIYASPDLPAVLPDHNLLGSWKIDYDALGYTRDEAMDRLNVGYMWHAMCLFVYMVFVVGGSLLLGVYRLAGSDGTGPDAVRSGVASVDVEDGRRPRNAGERCSLLPGFRAVFPGGR